MKNKIASSKQQYNNWQLPDNDALSQEYTVEYKLKPGLRQEIGDIWETVQDFLKAANKGKIITVTRDKDDQIDNRSYTTSQKDLLSLIKGYRSYPEFRNEKTLQNLYDRMSSNKELDMPIILKMPYGGYRIMSGNTRADVAMQLGDSYKALVIDASKPAKKGLFEQVYLNTEQNMSDIIANNNAREEETSFDQTIPMTNKPIPFPGDNVIANPISQETLISKLTQVFSGEKYAELGAIVGMLEAMSVFFQTLHWKVNGKSFYGDHLMFQRIYETFPEAIDGLAEKLVALSGTKIVDHDNLIKAMDVFLAHIQEDLALDASENGPQIQDVGFTLAKQGKHVLKLFIETTEQLINELEQKDQYSKGLDNLLADILDTQEDNVYLLKQRVLAGF